MVLSIINFDKQSRITYATITNACGSNADTIDVATLPAPVVNLGIDQSLCLEIHHVDPGVINATYLWRDVNRKFI
jgi:hypothetical protein